MLYWNITPGESVEWAFPKNYPGLPDEEYGWAFLVLENNVGRWQMDGDIGFDTDDPYYFYLGWDNSDEDPGNYPPVGEYTYTLYAGAEGSEGRVISTGLMIVGDYIPEREEVDKEIQYTQYGTTRIE